MDTELETDTDEFSEYFDIFIVFILLPLLIVGVIWLFGEWAVAVMICLVGIMVCPFMPNDYR